tara:strand:- start:2056 stop:2706 length:651 start_codon:yes stop_codon:yes gene_type:complete
MSAQHNSNVQIYKSRQNILSILESIYDYDVSEYTGFTFNEIDAMSKNDQLDMLLTNKMIDDKAVATVKTYIKYHLNGSLNENTLRAIIDDLYVFSNTLTSKDCLFIIYDGEPNDTLVNTISSLYNNENRFVIVYNLKRLQFNILEHSLVPKVTILTDEEVEEFKKKYNITSTFKTMPEISRFDPQAQAICLRPGQICKFIRNSPTSLETPYYRVCI